MQWLTSSLGECIRRSISHGGTQSEFNLVTIRRQRVGAGHLTQQAGGVREGSARVARLNTGVHLDETREGLDLRVACGQEPTHDDRR